MKLFHSENLLNLSAFRKIPRGTHKELFLRYSGTAQAGKTVAYEDLGTVRVNVRGTDRHNFVLSTFAGINSIKLGFPEATSNTGGSFAFSFLIPFHMWDDQTAGGEYFDIDEAYIQLSFPNMTTSLISAGTVEIYAIEAPAVSTYTLSLLQRNIQIGGAGQAAIELEFRNINSLYFKQNTNISNLLVITDGEEKANGAQASLLAKSSMVNRVESGFITTYEVDLNPYNEVRSNLNKETRVVLNATGATNFEMTAEIITVLGQDQVQKSLDYRSQKIINVAEEASA